MLKYNILITNSFSKGNIILKPTVKNGLLKDSEILIFHIRSISKERLIRKIGNISKVQLDELKQGLDDILRY